MTATATDTAAATHRHATNQAGGGASQLTSGAIGLLMPRALSTIQPRAQATANPAGAGLMTVYHRVRLSRIRVGSSSAITTSCIDSIPRLNPSRLSARVQPSKFRPLSVEA